MSNINQVLNNLDTKNNITHIFKQIPTTGGVISAIIAIIICVIIFKILKYVSRKAMRYVIRNIIITIIIYCTVFCTGLTITDIIALQNDKKAMLETIIEIANKQNTDLEITDTHIIYKGKSYKHHIIDIKNYIYQDENGKYIILE